VHINPMPRTRMGRIARSWFRHPVKSREFPLSMSAWQPLRICCYSGCDRPNAPLTALNLFAHPSHNPESRIASANGSRTAGRAA